MLSDGRGLFGSSGGVVLIDGWTWDFLPETETFIRDQVVLNDAQIYGSAGGIFGRLIRGGAWARRDSEWDLIVWICSWGIEIRSK